MKLKTKRSWTESNVSFPCEHVEYAQYSREHTATVYDATRNIYSSEKSTVIHFTDG